VPQQGSGGGWISGLTSGIGQMFAGLASDKGQAAIGNIYSAVATWREMDIRQSEASTAQKLAARANSWLNPGAYPSAATAPYVVGSPASPASPVRLNPGAWAGSILWSC
jgi:hypothetical protein